MGLRGQIQELQLKIENDHALLQAQTESKSSLKQHLADLQLSYTEVLTQSEKYKREILSKQDLINQITANNELLSKRMKRDILALENRNLVLEEMHGLRFEDLRTFSASQYQQIVEYISQIAHLKKLLQEETNERNALFKLLTEKTAKFDELALEHADKLSQLKIAEATVVKQEVTIKMQGTAISDRDAQIVNLQDSLSSLNQELESLKTQVTDLRAQRDTLAREIMMLEERLSTTVKPRVSRGTNPPKLK